MTSGESTTTTAPDGTLSRVVVSPAERAPITDLGPTSWMPEHFGADIMILAQAGTIGIQRKAFPSDFLASFRDGRLSTSLTNLSKLNRRILLLEGSPRWDFNGLLEGDSRDRGFSTFSLSQLRGITWSAFSELGVETHWTRDPTDTVQYVRDLCRWADKSHHDSVFRRPGAQRPEWVRQWSARDSQRWILQGFEGIGPQMADKILDHFGTLPLEWTATEAELARVPGIGPGRVAKLTRIVRAQPEIEEESGGRNKRKR